jgi:maltose O-acetyltransferase
MKNPLSPALQRKFWYLSVELSEFVTSHIISFIPSHLIRNFLYTLFFNIRIHPRSTIHMGAKFFGVMPELFSVKKTENYHFLRINEGSSVGDHCFLDLRGTILIGKNVNISSQVMIFTMEHDPQDPHFGSRSAPVTIEDYAWLATRSIILPGVTVGKGAVVAAGAVVTENVAPYTIVGGVPAKKIGERTRELDYNVNFRGFLK